MASCALAMKSFRGIMPLCQSDQMALAAVSLRTGAGRGAMQRGELRLELSGTPVSFA